MAKRVRYNPLRVDVIFEDERRATWKKVGSNLAVKGIEYTYLVKDRNFDRLNAWKFVVRDPNSYKNDIIVQPISAPNKKVWAGIDRRAIVLVKATKRNHSDKVYCKVNLADPTATRTKIGTSRGEREICCQDGLTTLDVICVSKGQWQRHMVRTARPKLFCSIRMIMKE